MTIGTSFWYQDVHQLKVVDSLKANLIKIIILNLFVD